MEQQALLQTANAALYGLEDAYFQYKKGFNSEERWNASRETIRWFMSGEAHINAREMYEKRPSVWSAEFQQVVNAIILEIDSTNID